MIWGIIGDTHKCEKSLINDVIEGEFRPRSVEVVVHTGDIDIEHVNRELFGDFPVLCVLVKHQAFNPDFCFAPIGWRFVRPAYKDDPPEINEAFFEPATLKELMRLKEYCDKARIFSRIVNYKDEVIYAGHERSRDLFMQFEKVKLFFNEINSVYDGVSLAFTAHTHLPFFYRSNRLAWLNAGAIDMPLNGSKGFAVYDSIRKEAVFARLSSAESRIHPTSVGILSDTYNVDDLDSRFWQRCRKSFNDRDVTSVICCGNFLPQDIGREELSGLQVYYYLQSDYVLPAVVPENWHAIDPANPIIEIAGHNFYVQHGIGSEQGSMSEIERDQALRDIRSRYSHLDYIIAGLGSETIYQEFEKYAFINPGDARDLHYYAVLCLPRREYTFGIVGT